MDVIADCHFREHNRSQYDEVDSPVTNKGEGPKYCRRLGMNTSDSRWRITLSNVWLEVPRLEGRADAKFKFDVQLRESELKGESRACDGDHYWRCERMSTEPLDEDTAQRRREQREER